MTTRLVYQLKNQLKNKNNNVFDTRTGVSRTVYYFTMHILNTELTILETELTICRISRHVHL